MIASTRAIVLNTHQYGDTSLICNLFSEDYGKLSVISKGARTVKNPNRAILQPLNYIELCYYYKAKRNIQFLKEASINNHYFKLKKNYKKLLYGYAVIDIVNQTSQAENSCNIIFRLSHKVLKKINDDKNNNSELYFIFFQIQLLRYLGYQPIIDRCSKCNIKDSVLSYNDNIGQLMCNQCTPAHNDQITLNHNALAIIKFLTLTHIDSIVSELKIELNLNDIKKFLYHYISYHIIDGTKIKSYKMLA